MTQSEAYVLKENASYKFKQYSTIIGDRIGRLLNFLTVSSLLVACTGFFQTLGGYILLGATPNFGICFAVFLMTFGIYNINKLTDIKEDAINRPDRLDFLDGREENILFFSVYAILFSAVITYFNKKIALLILLIPFTANCVYSSQIHTGLPRLKDIPFVKNIVVGLSWALVCTLMPAVTLKGGLHLLPVASVIYLMLIKDFINSTLCDLKDVNGDRENSVKTIPVIFGCQKTRQILMLLNTMLLPLLFLVKGKTLIIFSLLILTEYAFILCLDESSCPTVLEFFVDGEWLLTSLLLFGLGVIG